MLRENMSEREQYCYDKGKSEWVDSCMDTIMEINKKLKKLYTQEELDKVVKDEREACIGICENETLFALDLPREVKSRIAEDIRSRGE